ncbi:TPA: MFS transporter [Klebsiella oxytoca]|uniref:MFS transporter n=1 Tax=Klebsiella oxytoca TaxID=571 RepID=A0AAN5RGW9_KLEOX|nr:MFS transporter [Klebsiella oxytoca]
MTGLIKMTEAKSGLPVFQLGIIGAALFLSILTEALPAGFLHSLELTFHVSASEAGQWVTLYAVGSLLSAVPLTLVTQHWSRKKLLLMTLAGFAISNGLTATVDSFVITLVARFLAGIFAGLLWALAAGYAGRMVTSERQGRAITIVMLGVPLALSLGVPAGTFLGNIYGWRTVFYTMTLLAGVLFIVGVLILPEQPGVSHSERFSVRKVVAIPGVKTILVATFIFSLGHNMMYTYISPYLTESLDTHYISTFLLIFGVMAVVSIIITGIFIDRYLRFLTLSGLFLFMVSSLILSFLYENIYFVMSGAFLWGLGFGGGATLFQTASARTSGKAADIAQSLMVTIWNMAIAGGGLIGGILLAWYGILSLPVVLTILLILCLFIVNISKAKGFLRM